MQTAAKIVLEPIFEADFEDSAYGYRPRRGAVDAVKEVHRHICRGYTDVVDADLSKYFDTIPHADLMRCVARRIVDRHVLRLIKMWLRAPIEERDGDGKRRIVGGKGNRRGTPQGGVASPLLANIYMNRFLKHWRLTGCDEALRAHVVAYADDFVILSRGCATEALAWTKAVMTKLGLMLNEAKTSLRDARQERFDFLGYSFGPHRYKANGQSYLSASPSKKSMQRLKTKVANLLVPANNDPWPELRDTLNRSLLGWSNYFCVGARRSAFRGIDRYVYERVRDFLARRRYRRRPPQSPMAERRVSGRLAAARFGAKLAVRREQLRSAFSSKRHIRFQKGEAAGSPRRDIVGRELDDLHTHSLGKCVRLGSDCCKVLPHAPLRVVRQLAQDFLMFGRKALPRLLIDHDHK